MRPYRIVRLIASALVAISALLASVGSPPRITRAAAPLCGTLIQNVSGAIAANTTWSPANIYVLTGDVTVNTGVTLVIQPGTVIKAKTQARLLISGTLTSDGTAVNPIYFTSWNDDSLCGDTNGDGTTTTPAVSDWGYIEFTSGSNDISSLSRAVLRYGGLGYSTSPSGVIILTDASPNLAYLSMEHNHRNAVQLWTGGWNTVTLGSSTVVYLLVGDITVNSNQTMTIVPGAKIKATAQARLLVNGKLTADGTVANPIYFTSEKDDTVCGLGASDELVCDTNNAVDGPTTSDWGYIEFTAGSNDTSSVSRAVLRYGGLGYSTSPSGVIILTDASPNLAYLSMEHNHRNAVQLWTGGWNTVTLGSSTVVYLLVGDITVNSNQTMTIVPGAKIKATAQARLLVNGKLTADGVSSNPIFFTSEKDDTVCGYGASDELICDTNNAVDGPATSDWGYIEFTAGSNDTSSLSRAVLRYGGLGYSTSPSGVIILTDASPNLAYLSMEHNHRNAVQLWTGGWNTVTLGSSTVVYLLVGDITVNSNQTMTIVPGAKIKATAQARLLVNGKFTADGTPATDVTSAMPITFTSEKDDTVCGVGASNEQVCDTNNAVDGPAPRDWGYISFSAGSNASSSLTWADLRYGGLGYNSPLSGVLGVNNAVTIGHARFQQNYIGLDIGSGALPTLTCNDFVGNQAFGMRNNQPATVVSATGQWWNSTTGPTYSANVGGTGEKISDGIAYSPWANTACAPTVPVTTTPWLVLLYMAGDNSGTGSVSLSPPMRELLTRLGSMAYNPNMRLVVLFDGDNASGGDTHIYTREQSGMVDVTEEAAKNWLGGMGGSSGARELDTGSASSLSTFVNWATTAYPGATHTMLSVVDHGGGWAPSIGLPGQPRGGKNVQAGSWRGMNLDLTSVGGSSLATRDLGQALRNTVHLDVLMLDACLMGMLENAYELRNYADFLVSGENVLFADLPYEAYLASDGLTATTSPLGLARRIVTNYNTGANLQEQPFAMSVTDLRQLRDGVAGSLPTLLNTLATKMLLALPAAPTDSDPLVLALTQIYSQTQKFDYDSSMAIEPHEGYVDLVDFASKLRDSSNAAVPADVRSAAGDLVAAANTGSTPVIDTNRAISGNYNGTAWNLSGANGLSIFLPLGEQDYRPTKADPNDPTKSLAERQLRYYADQSQLMLTHDVPQWAALLVRLEPTVPIIRTGPGGLPTTAAASLAAAPSIDTRAFNTPGQVVPGAAMNTKHYVYLPLIRR